MPLYELFVISRTAASGSASKAQLKETIKRTTGQLLDYNAMVRQIEYLGTKKLPYRMKHKETYLYSGSYWQLQFFSGPQLLERMRFHLKYDPDVIRYTFLKRADQLKDFVRQ